MFCFFCFLILEITSIVPNGGSTQGHTIVTITGKYLYHSSIIPANITVAGMHYFINYNQLLETFYVLKTKVQYAK